MASLRDIQKRIKSAKSTEKITKAMKMVAASKLRKAQENVSMTKCYSIKFDEVISNLIACLQFDEDSLSPLLLPRKKKENALFIVLTSNRGLCGGFNSNIIRSTKLCVSDNANKFKKIHISTIGKKGHDAFVNCNFNIYKNYENISGNPTLSQATNIFNDISNSFISNKIDAVWLIYNEFKSVVSQSVVLKQILPLAPLKIKNEKFLTDYIYEPKQVDLLNYIIPRYFSTKLFQALLESTASEHGARMSAMDNAVRNAKEMIKSLNLKYNRIRQSAITSELMEIISGAEALQ